MSEEEFVALNPAHNKPVAVASEGTLILPLDKAEAFRANLESYDKPLVSWTTYQAKKGESLDAIARRHNVTAMQLKVANDPLKLDKKGRLRASGPVLVPIAKDKAQPVRVAHVVPVPTASVGAAPVRAAVTLKLYTVRAGDTLFGIAQRYRTGVETLLSLNNLSANAILQPGLKLRLP